MPLDQFSLFVAIGFSGASLGLTLFLMWSVGRSENHLLIWSAGLASLVAGVVAFIAVIGRYDANLLLASFVLLMAGFGFLYAGSARFCSRRSNWLTASAVVAAGVLATSAAFLLGYSGLGTIIANVMIGVLLALAGHQYWIARAEFPVLMAANAALFLLTALSFVACGYALVDQGQYVLSARPANWAEDINSIVVIIGLTGIGTISLTLHQARIASRHKSEARLDVLTGLLNRRALFENPPVPIPATTAVVVMDVDHFKRINDQFGHDAGDRALKTFADVIRASIQPDDVAARLGGEEFCLVLPNTSPRASMAIVERIRAAIETLAVATPSGVVRTTVSAGVVYSTGLETLQSLLARADEALYQAKASGRNRIRVAGSVRPAAGQERSPHPTIVAPPIAEQGRREMASADALSQDGGAHAIDPVRRRARIASSQRS